MQNLPNGVDISMSTEIKCENESCGNNTFKEVFLMRKISKLITGSPNDSYLPIPTFQCASCGHINKEFTVKIEK